MSTDTDTGTDTGTDTDELELRASIEDRRHVEDPARRAGAPVPLAAAQSSPFSFKMRSFSSASFFSASFVSISPSTAIPT